MKRTCRLTMTSSGAQVFTPPSPLVFALAELLAPPERSFAPEPVPPLAVPLLRFCSEPSSAPSKLECADIRTARWVCGSPAARRPLGR
eukprot:scaffold44825_cov67-Phaeocystis_antarctica.AAC.1